jgi:two-component system nitrate/nitrite response regulator NarL
MASTPMSVATAEGVQPEESKGTIRLILADTQAIFRAGLRKIFALEDDIRVVGQA